MRLVLRAFVRRYRVDLGDAERPLAAYRSFTDFFTRRLAPGARPLPADPAALVSPADGTVAARDRVRAGRLIQAKGIDYEVARLLGDPGLAAGFEGGEALTVYLAPRDYHRVHAPWSGTLRRRLHRGGRLLSVSADTARRVRDLFADNERVVLVLDDPALGTWALVLVGALIVGGIETVWEGTVNPGPPDGVAERRFDGGDEGEGEHTVARGDEIGFFRAGSTVIVLLPPGGATLAPLGPGDRLRVGEAIGTVLGATPGGADP